MSVYTSIDWCVCVVQIISMVGRIENDAFHNLGLGPDEAPNFEEASCALPTSGG